MAGVKRLLNAGMIGVAALLLVLSLSVMPQAAFADEAEGAAGEGAVSAAPDDGVSADESQSIEGDVAVDDGDDAAAVDDTAAVDDAAAVDDVGGEASAGGAENASPCLPEQAGEAGASEDLDVSAESDVDELAADEDPAQAVAMAAEAQSESEGWGSDDTGYYYIENGSKKSGWLVTASASPLGGTGGGLERYFLEGGYLVVSSLIDADDAGYWAYATAFGYVVRGKYTASDGTVYLADDDGRLEDAGWLVTAAYDGGLQRYYIDPEKHGAVPGLSTAGYAHYTTNAGYVLRGMWDNGAGRVYVADDDGLLACGSEGGWLVTGIYTNGELQRYYIDPETHAAKTSYFTVEGSHYFGQGGVGYVLRGAGSGFNSKSQASRLYADNDGRLATSRWVCTDAFGQGFQRYWFDSTSAMAVSRLIPASEAGYNAYATSEGYVLRGSLDSGAGYVYLADDDGRLVSGSGWLVTGLYTNGELQRYYLVERNGVSVARTSGFEVDGSHYYGQADVGYVLRGKLRYGEGMLLADNDGKLAWTEGWLVTGIYDGGELQRYRIDSAPGNGLMGARVGYFELEGSKYCGREDEGYVYRNTICSIDGNMYSADNDGVLTYLTEESLMLHRINGYSSGTGWLIAVDRSTHKVGVFSGSANNWSLQRYFSCVVGASGTPTITGLYHTTGGKKYALSTDARAIYCTQIYGGYFFHSVLESTSELGQSLSHGCIRLAWDDANWIYRNIWGGTTVYIYN